MSDMNPRQWYTGVQVAISASVSPFIAITAPQHGLSIKTPSHTPDGPVFRMDGNRRHNDLPGNLAYNIKYKVYTIMALSVNQLA